VAAVDSVAPLTAKLRKGSLDPRTISLPRLEHDLEGSLVHLAHDRKSVQAAFEAAWQDPEFQRFGLMADSMPTEIAKRSQAEACNSARYVAILDRKTGVLAGEAEMVVGMEPGVELGYWVDATFRRRGFAIEAIALMANWVTTALPGSTLRLRVHVDNPPGRATAVKAGFAEESRDDDERRPLITYVRYSSGSA
jgi:RimJ/RimL family protein N-acetyltransferase